MNGARRVVVFGTFDPLHAGHRYFFKQARSLGSYLLVVVATDVAVRAAKHHEPEQPAASRLEQVAADPAVDEARLGDDRPQEYQLLTYLDFDVIALGYDQKPSDAEVRALLDQAGKSDVAIVRLDSYQPEIFKSSLLKDKDEA